MCIRGSVCGRVNEYVGVYVGVLVYAGIYRWEIGGIGRRGKSVGVCGCMCGWLWVFLGGICVDVCGRVCMLGCGYVFWVEGSGGEGIYIRVRCMWDVCERLCMLGYECVYVRVGYVGGVCGSVYFRVWVYGGVFGWSMWWGMCG